MDRQRRIFKTASFFLLIATFLGTSCAPRAQMKPEQEAQFLKGTPLEQRAFEEIETSFAKEAFDTAERRIKEFKKRFPVSAMEDSVDNYLGLIALEKNQPDEAAEHFEKAIKVAGDRPTKNYYLYNLATAKYASRRIQEALRLLNEIELDEVDQNTRIKVYFLRANIFEKRSLPLETARQLLSATRRVSSLEKTDQGSLVSQHLEQALQNISDLDSLYDLYDDNEDSILSDAVLFRICKLELGGLGIRNPQKAESNLRLLIRRYPKSSYASEANFLLSELLQTTVVEANTIGVLLPISGRFQKFGDLNLDAIALGLGIFGPDISQDFMSTPDSGRKKIKLVIEDSGETPRQAVEALNRLVTQHHAIAVIGPLLSKGVDDVAERAQQLGVPLLSLARRSAPKNPYFFEASVTQSLQAYEIARYAITKLNMKKLAIAYPNDKMGQEVSNDFWDAVESFGGSIVGIESYIPGEADFRQLVDKLSGLFYLSARQRELKELEKLREEKGIKRRNRHTEKYFALSPIVDYDAIFIPDEATVAGQIIPTFAYRDIENVHFLGISAWHSPEFLKRTTRYAKSAKLVDSFLKNDDNPLTESFVREFRVTFSRDPSSLEALAFDAARILRTKLEASPDISRENLRSLLTDVQEYPGVTGTISYHDGTYYRALKLIGIQRGEFIKAF